MYTGVAFVPTARIIVCVLDGARGETRCAARVVSAGRRRAPPRANAS